MNVVQIVCTLSSEGHFFVFGENEKDPDFEQTEHVGVLVYTLCLISSKPAVAYGVCFKLYPETSYTAWWSLFKKSSHWVLQISKVFFFLLIISSVSVLVSIDYPSRNQMLSVCCNAPSLWVAPRWSYSNSYIRACILSKYCLWISKHWPAFSLL